MRLLYWLDYRLHGLFVGIGEWAWKKPHRPYIVYFATSFAVAAVATGVLKLIGLAFRP